MREGGSPVAGLPECPAEVPSTITTWIFPGSRLGSAHDRAFRYYLSMKSLERLLEVSSS